MPEAAATIAALRQIELTQSAPLLNGRIAEGYRNTLERLSSRPGVRILRDGSNPEGEYPTPTLLATDVATLLADFDGLFAECFGPAALVVNYTDEQELIRVAEAVDGQLTATLVAEETDAVAADLTRILAGKAGRLLWNQWPTGVSVTYAQHTVPIPGHHHSGHHPVGTGASRPSTRRGLPELPPASAARRAGGQASRTRRVNGILQT